MHINIDPNSGFCFGVVNAINKAEEELCITNKLYCLGDIVHNSAEVNRLTKKGLITINHSEYQNLKNCKVLIRAHGEPPETYKTASNNNIELIDASCPVVLKLQKKIKKGFEEITKKKGQIVIFGKKGHAEVIALLGQTSKKGIVVSNFDDLDKLDFFKPINIFSQTTQSVRDYTDITNEIKKRLQVVNNKQAAFFVSNNTICGQVTGRDKQLSEFSKNNNVIIFVSGKKSSNGKVLFEICRRENEQTYFVSSVNELKKEWFKNVDTVGICGATSTPFWLMEKIKTEIKKLKPNSRQPTAKS